jgi:hypothetical protein
VNVKFGKTLTEVAKFPKLSAVDPVERRKVRRRRFWCCFIALLLAAAAFCYFTDRLTCIGLPFHKPQPVEEAVEAPADSLAAADTVALADAPVEEVL